MNNRLLISLMAKEPRHPQLWRWKSAASKVITLAVSFTMLSGTAMAGTLLQAYQDAKENDALLKAQETSFLALLENKPQVLAGKKPQINLSGNIGLNQIIELHDASTGGNLAGSYTLGLSKSLYNKNLDAQIDKVDASLVQAKIQLEEQRQALIIRVAQPYFAYLTAIDNLKVAETEKSAVKQQLEQVKVFFEVGTSPITDLKEAESRYNLAVSQAVSAEQATIDASENLRVVTGKPYPQISSAAANLPLSIPSPQNIQSWIDIAKQNSKPLLAARQAIEVARQQLEVQRSTRKPVVNLYARHTGNFTLSEAPLDPVTIGASVGVEASMPIYQGGAIDSKIRQAQHEFRQAQQNYSYQERLIESQVRSAYLTIQSNISQVQAQQRALISAETAAQATKTGFEVGTRTAVDVLGSLSDVFAARRDYTSTRYRYLLSTLQLRSAAGTLSEADLREMNRLLSGQSSGVVARSGRAGNAQQQARLQAQRRQQQQQQARLQAQRRQQQHEARLRAEKQKQIQANRLREQRLRAQQQ